MNEQRPEDQGRAVGLPHALPSLEETLEADESTRLIAKNRPLADGKPKNEGPLTTVQTTLLAGLLVAALLAALLTVHLQSTADDATTVIVDDGPFAWTLASSDYDPLPQFTADSSSSSSLRYTFLSDDYDGIIEPYKKTELYIISGASLYNEVTVKVCSRTRACETGAPSFSLECAAGDDYDVFVTASNATATVVFTGKAKCLYVRRELRDLTDEDLALTMDTMHTLYDTEDQEGMATYGANFLSNSYLTRMHHLNSALQDADHVHEGNGFLAQHIKITNMFEKSMQAVNPAVSLPYWDFTIDSAQGLAIYETFPFTADVFGSIPLPKGGWFSYENESVIEGRIPDGRWANLTADTNTLYSSVKQAYGYMRAPWNLNPSPYVSRFSSRTDVAKDLPACLSHYKLLSSTSLMSFSYDIAYAPHAAAHSLSGGTYGCDKFSPLLSAGYLEDEDALYSLCGKWVFFLKEFYRNWNALPNTDGCTAPTEEQLAVDGSFFCGWQCDGGNNTANLEANLFAKLSSYVPEDMSSNSSHEGWVAWKEIWPLRPSSSFCSKRTTLSVRLGFCQKVVG